MKKRLVMISNRLPVSVQKKKNKIMYKPSVGGLATGVGSLIGEKFEGMWIGWPGILNEKINQTEKSDIKNYLDEKQYCPVYFNKTEMDNFYSGFCNRTLWPLFHYFTQHAIYQDKMWNAYVKANNKYFEAALELIKPGDIVWIHDYHLLLLPKLLREKKPDITIGFFLHIPFPSFEVFRLLPWRKEILEGILGADLIGFHTYDYVRHFRNSVRNSLGYEDVLGLFDVENRKVKVETFPMGIDYKPYAQAENMDEVKKKLKKFRKKTGNHKVILSVDRLDYTKGIIERLYAFDRFLEKYPQFTDHVTLILVAVPSRTKVDNYRNLKNELDQLVGNINGKYGSVGWVPIWYLYYSLPFHSLTALYILSDVALITPVRDGMNLIAKEYVAAQKNGRGVLILSEMAGAAKELSEALIVNPNNLSETADTIYKALTMPEDDQCERIRLMQKRIQTYDIHIWANDFITNLLWIKEQNIQLLSKKITPSISKKIISDYHNSQQRLILLDYDGTLVSFSDKPQQAKPDETVYKIIDGLIQDTHNDVIIISGRDKETLNSWFGDRTIGLIAEHGVWIKEKNANWHLIETLRNDWKQVIRPVLERYVNRTPGSLIEEKDFTLVWHFRKSDIKLASIRARELKETLLSLTDNLGLEIVEGHKIIEIRNMGVNKGAVASKWIEKNNYDFIIACGDDRTDEDTFKILPDHAYSVKVGMGSTSAKYYIESVEKTRSLLKNMVEGENV